MPDHPTQPRRVQGECPRCGLIQEIEVPSTLTPAVLQTVVCDRCAHPSSLAKFIKTLHARRAETGRGLFDLDRQERELAKARQAVADAPPPVLAAVKPADEVLAIADAAMTNIAARDSAPRTVYCLHCEAACSDRAKTCPRCGHPLASKPVEKPRRRKRTITRGKLIVACVNLAAVVIFASLYIHWRVTSNAMPIRETVLGAEILASAVQAGHAPTDEQLEAAVSLAERMVERGHNAGFSCKYIGTLISTGLNQSDDYWVDFLFDMRLTEIVFEECKSCGVESTSVVNTITEWRKLISDYGHILSRESMIVTWSVSVWKDDVERVHCVSCAAAFYDAAELWKPVE